MPGETNIDERPQDYGINAGPGHTEDLDEKMDPEKEQELIDEISEKAKEDGQPSKEDLDKISEEAKSSAYHFFVVHESSGKVEVLKSVQPGVVSYAYDPGRVTPNDLRYIAGAVVEVLPDTDIQFLLVPGSDAKRATVWLDIKNRSNIKIGTIEWWRYNK